MSQYKPIRVRFFIIAVVASILLGLGILPAIDKGNELWQQHLYQQMLVTEPAYQLRTEIELAYPDVLVLNVFENEEFVTVWLYLIEIGVEDVANIIVMSAQYFPGRLGYACVLAFPAGVNTVYTLDGERPYLRSEVVVVFNPEAIAAIIEVGCTECVLQQLAEAGGWFHRYYAASLSGVMPREPGYKWPWE